jgi:hypothetical protein
MWSSCEFKQVMANVKKYVAGCDNSRTNVPEVRQNYGLVLICF